MSDMKKVLTLVACGCICLMVATSASADFTGVKAVNKDDPATEDLCTQANGPGVEFPVTVCNVSAMFDGDDRLLSIGNSELQVFNGAETGVFFHHVAGTDTSPTTFLLGLFPDLICDSFVAIGWKENIGGNTDATATEDDFDSGDGDFNGNGHITGGWFNAAPPNGQGDVLNGPPDGPNGNGQVLFLQSSVLQGRSMSGFTTIFWQTNPGGDVISEIDHPIECVAKCTEGDECDDGDPCTNAGGPDFCTEGVCTGVPLDCTGLDDDCNEGVCVDGACESNPTNEGGGCDDGNACTGPDTCSNGVCSGTGCQTDSDCSDGNDCTTDICDAGSGCCTSTPDCTSDADCDDGIDCTIDTCNGDCCSNAPDDDACDDGNGCTDNTCDADSGCTSTPNNASCSDGDQCTINDGCANGQCAGEPVQCPPGSDCNPDNGDCEFCQTDADCDDGLNCNGAETCDPGTGCQAGTDVDCSGAGDQCNVGVCVEPGDCVQEPANEGGTCDDGTECTNNDTCSGGSCSGEDLEPCPDGQVCDPGTGDCVDAPSGFLDIIPGKCPNRLREHGLGFLKVALVSSSIEGEEFDACDANVDSLLLVNDSDENCGGAVAPRSRSMCKDRATPFLGELCDCHSRRKDGLDDLDMKFKLSELRTALCLDALPAGTIIRLCLTGEMNDGSPINVCDCVMVDRPGGGTPGPGGG